MDTRVGRRVWDDMGGWDGYRYTLLRIKQRTNENQLYTAQGLYSVLCGDLNGKEMQNRGDICVCIADSRCCTRETNTTL